MYNTMYGSIAYMEGSEGQKVPMKEYLGGTSKLASQIKELEKNVKVLQDSYDKEQKKVAALESRLLETPQVLSIINYYFDIKKDDNGLIIGISPNRKIGKARKNKQINAIFNGLNSYLSYSRCDSLVSLSLDYAHLTSVPDIVWTKTALQKLDLTRNEICELPCQVSNLECLKKITLLGCALNDLPITFGKLKQLEKLDMSWNIFCSIPDCVYELPKLEVLWIDRNPITFIPNDIKKLQSLRQLWVSGCPITFVSKHIGSMSKLKVFGLEYASHQAIMIYNDFHKMIIGYWPVLILMFGIVCILFFGRR